VISTILTPATDYAKPATWNYRDAACMIISLSIWKRTNAYVRSPPQVVIRLLQKYSRIR